MATTSSLFTAGPEDKITQADVGYLPRCAITEWLRADAPCDVDLEEDACGNICGDALGKERFTPGQPSAVIRRRVKTSHTSCRTNLAWAKEEVRQHNLRHPNRPWIVKASHLNKNYICICKAMGIDDNE
jgi:hypothetical protein